MWYEGSGTSNRRFLHPDERGSIVAVTDSSGAIVAVNNYDEHGIPGSANAGRFQYTGQAWLPELGLYYYKSRIYSPSLGRFLQTDPIRYRAGMNLYAYVRGDPLNLVDPLGLQEDDEPVDGGEIYVNGCPTGSVTTFDGGCTAADADRLDPPPPVCSTVSTSGNTITITIIVQFYDGDYPKAEPDPGQQPSKSSDVDFYIKQWETGRFAGQTGRYMVDINVSRGDGGLIVMLGDPVIGGAVDSMGGNTMWLPNVVPGWEANPARLADHELGHHLLNPHSEALEGYAKGQPPNIMDAAANGDATEPHYDTLLKKCGLF